MRSPARLLFVLLLGSLLLPSLVQSETSPPPAGSTPAEADPVVSLEQNRKLLDKWRHDADHFSRLQEDLNAFWRLPAVERQRLRQLDLDIHKQNSEEQKSLWGVLESYHAWLGRLPSDQYQYVTTAPDAKERLRRIRELRDREWLKQLPLKVQQELEPTPEDKKPGRITELRREERERRGRFFTTTPSGPQRNQPRNLDDFSPEVQTWVKDHLLNLLSPPEREELNNLAKHPFPQYARKLVDLAEKHPLPFPGPVPPLTIKDSPENIRRAFPPQRWQKEIQAAQGKWPDFGKALLREGKGRSLLASIYTPSKLSDFPPALQQFVKDKFTEEEYKRLEEQNGKWPEFPEKLMEIARKKSLTVPGMKLPIDPVLLDKIRLALPELPNRTLYGFFSTLDEKVRRELDLSFDSADGRERIKSEFFKRHPGELRRLEHLDFGRPPRWPMGPPRGER
jgi:hypothetical protein